MTPEELIIAAKWILFTYWPHLKIDTDLIQLYEEENFVCFQSIHNKDNWISVFLRTSIDPSYSIEVYWNKMKYQIGATYCQQVLPGILPGTTNEVDCKKPYLD